MNPNKQLAHDSFRRAIALVGGQTPMAKLIGCTQGAISKRLSRGDGLSAEEVPVVETATGISRFDLRPDVFGEDPLRGLAA